jgi:hypothetical protein
MPIVLQRAVRPQESLLRRVFREGSVACDAARRSEGRGSADADELRKRVVVAVARELDQPGLLREVLGARASGPDGLLANRCPGGRSGRRSGRWDDGSGVSGAHESGFHASDQAFNV